MNRLTIIVLVLIAAGLAGVYFFRESRAPETPPSVDTSTTVMPLPLVTEVEENKNVPLIAANDGAAPVPSPGLDRNGDSLGSMKGAFTTAFAAAFDENLARCLPKANRQHQGQTYELEVHTGHRGDSVMVESVNAERLPLESTVRACLEKSFINQVIDVNVGAEPRHLLLPVKL